MRSIISLALPWEGKPASYNEDNQKYYDEMGEIPYFGCVIDTSSVTTELTACYNALLEFVPSLTLGANEDPQAIIDQLIQRLNSSGIDKVIDCYQTQLDAWLAEQ